MTGLIEGEDYGEIEATAFEKTVADSLRQWGEVRTQVRVPDRGDGRGGRIDLVADAFGVEFPIEIDRVSARTKSIFKVSSYPEGGFVITRSPITIKYYPHRDTIKE